MNTEHLHRHTVIAGEVGEGMSHGHVSVGAGTTNCQPGGRFGHLFSFHRNNRKAVLGEGGGSRLHIICPRHPYRKPNYFNLIV